MVQTADLFNLRLQPGSGRLSEAETLPHPMHFNPGLFTDRHLLKEVVHRRLHDFAVLSPRQDPQAPRDPLQSVGKLEAG